METNRIDTFELLLEEARRGDKSRIAVVSAENDDILVVHDIETGNILNKILTILSHTYVAAIVLGLSLSLLCPQGLILL